MKTDEIKKLIIEYQKNQDDFVNAFTITTHKKRKKDREIIAYKHGDSNGISLRRVHTELLGKLEKSYKSNSRSFAYKTGMNCHKAVKEHLKSNFFIKTDIKSFFETISLDYFKEICPEIINAKLCNQISFNDVLTICFYKNHLPLGYVTSPIISDIYLSKFDNEISEYLKDKKFLHYSRYSDDILISSEGKTFTDLEELFEIIKRELKKVHLCINESKTRKVELQFKPTSAPSITFLGLIISKEDEVKNRITISKSFICKTLDLIDEYKHEHVKNVFKRARIISSIYYLKNNSENSYQRFLKKYKNRFGSDYEDHKE